MVGPVFSQAAPKYRLDFGQNIEKKPSQVFFRRLLNKLESSFAYLAARRGGLQSRPNQA